MLSWDKKEERSGAKQTNHSFEGQYICFFIKTRVVKQSNHECQAKSIDFHMIPHHLLGTHLPCPYSYISTVS